MNAGAQIIMESTPYSSSGAAIFTINFLLTLLTEMKYIQLNNIFFLTYKLVVPERQCQQTFVFLSHAAKEGQTN